MIARNRWSLNERALALLLARLGDQPELAAEEYRALHGRLSAFFTWRGAAAPEELADATLDRVMQKLEAGVSVAQVSAYAHAVARRVLLEAQKGPAPRVAAEPAPPEEVPASAEPREPAAEEVAACLDACLAALPAAERELVLDYYGGEPAAQIAHRKSLAERRGVSPNRLRARIFRIRARLEECLRRRLRELNESISRTMR